MKYTIKIEKTYMKEVPESQSYEAHAKPEVDGDGGWGYVTKPAHIREATVEVYRQEVEDVDMLAIVAAINKAEWK